MIGPWNSTAIGTNSPCDESPAYLTTLLDAANSAAVPAISIIMITMTEQTLLDNNVVESQFHLSSLHNPLFNRVLRYKSEHPDLLQLTNPVSTVLQQRQIVNSSAAIYSNKINTIINIIYKWWPQWALSMRLTFHFQF